MSLGSILGSLSPAFGLASGKGLFGGGGGGWGDVLKALSPLGSMAMGGDRGNDGGIGDVMTARKPSTYGAGGFLLKSLLGPREGQDGEGPHVNPADPMQGGQVDYLGEMLRRMQGGQFG